MTDDELERLKSRLQWEAGPFADLSSRGLQALSACLGALARELGERTRERPLISLLVAFELGFAAGQWRQRRAQR